MKRENDYRDLLQGLERLCAKKRKSSDVKERIRKLKEYIEREFPEMPKGYLNW